MVIKNQSFQLVLFSLVIIIMSTHFTICRAQTITYTVNKEWVQIIINKDRSISLLYNITITYTSGSPRGIIDVGMPKGGFQISSVQDLSGNNLDYTDISSGDYYGIEVTLNSLPILNQPNTIIVYATVPEMLSPDNMNQGYYGMQFYPTTFPDALGLIDSLRVAIVLPSGVTSSEVLYYDNVSFDNEYNSQEGNLVVYWERTNWQAWLEFTVGVSFPENYINLPGPDIVTIVAIGAAVVAAIGFVLIIVSNLRKFDYIKPRIGIEALGAQRNLTSVEAAVVLDSKPARVLTMILFGLIYKRVVMVTEADPIIKIQKLQSSAESPPRLRYYEIDYLDGLQPDGSLDEMKLAQTYLDLRDTVDQKMRGYSRSDTVNYYQSVVNKAWDQVTQAGTPELKGDAIDQNIEWLLADDRFDEKFRNVFPPNIIIVPSPGWWWYWHGPHFPSGPIVVPAGTPVPSKIPAQSIPIPGQDFANNIVKGLQTSANNMVKNVQAFTNRIVQAPAPVQASRSSVRSGPSCVCACAHCACACACVSCACACAHGGAR